MVFWSNDLQWTGLGYGLLLGFVGALMSCLGLCIWSSILATCANAKRLLGAKSREANGKVLAKEVRVMNGGELDSQRPGFSRGYYLITYVFDAVRDDGMTCRTEVRQRKLPSLIFNTLEVGSVVKVRHLHEDPRLCRITAAAEHEAKGFLGMRLRSFVALVLFSLGVFATVLSVLDHHVAGAIAWASVVALHLLWMAVGRKCLRRLCACFACEWLQEARSPLFVHSGYVFFAELGKQVEPSCEPTSLLPENVGMLVDIPNGWENPHTRKPNRTWTQAYESECRKGGVV